MSHFWTRPYYSLSEDTTVKNGANFGGLGLSAITVQSIGIVAGDVIQIFRSNDGVTWYQDGSDITTNTITDLTPGAVYYRARLNAIAGGGSVSAVFAGAS